MPDREVEIGKNLYTIQFETEKDFTEKLEILKTEKGISKNTKPTVSNTGKYSFK